ncbi:hypothetical protein PENNAL_c0008G04836 [Penicillium nalgiovense]|uniref:Uncharacterized protein n=1 Tax=Penicillium nalgiovense TaxID=60175 RepID=A0A1V6YWX9_PENNA|nr:hypothetical protein PENNAL_c0008G04836 [Penicillium nalgiovense]
MVNIPTWESSYGLDVPQPYKRGSYEFEDMIQDNGIDDM